MTKGLTPKVLRCRCGLPSLLGAEDAQNSSVDLCNVDFNGSTQARIRWQGGAHRPFDDPHIVLFFGDKRPLKLHVFCSHHRNESLACDCNRGFSVRDRVSGFATSTRRASCSNEKERCESSSHHLRSGRFTWNAG